MSDIVKRVLALTACALLAPCCVIEIPSFFDSTLEIPDAGKGGTGGKDAAAGKVGETGTDSAESDGANGSKEVDAELEIDDEPVEGGSEGGTGGSGGGYGGGGGSGSSGSSGGSPGGGGGTGGTPFGGGGTGGLPYGGGGAGGCALSRMYFAHEFSFADQYASAVEVRGNFMPHGWEDWMGIGLTKKGSTWYATAWIPCGMTFQYKFVLNNLPSIADNWRADNCTQVTDSFGNTNCELVVNCPEYSSKSWYSCGTTHPLDNGTSDCTCSIKFGYHERADASVAVAGSFNGWTAGINYLTGYDRDWTVRVAGFRWNSLIDYKFVIDDREWRTDPANTWVIMDEWGNENSRTTCASSDLWTCW